MAAPEALSNDEKCLSGKRVLVVDSGENGPQVVRLASDWNLEIELAQLGAAAVSCMIEADRRGQPFDLTLVDEKLKDMHAGEFRRQVESLPRLSKVPIIVLLSQEHRAEAARLKPLGFAGYLTRPVCQRALGQTLLAIWGENRDTAGEAGLAPSANNEASDRKNSALSVLLVDDSIINQKVAKKMLAKLGCDVEIARDGLQALNRLKEHSFHLVFMDCQMPEMDGFAATKAFREWESDSRRTPIIAMTASDTASDRERCLQAGMDDHIAKPVSVDSLRKVLQKWKTGEICAADRG